MAGARLRANGRRPYFCAICANAAGVPGIAAASGPLSDNLGITCPALSRYRVAVAASGARSRASTITSNPSLARCNNQNPPPPRPELAGSTTANAAAVATAASNALPPCTKMLWPASVASGWALAIAAAGGPAAAATDQQTQTKKMRSEEHTSELQSPVHLVCRLLLEKK